MLIVMDRLVEMQVCERSRLENGGSGEQARNARRGTPNYTQLARGRDVVHSFIGDSGSHSGAGNGASAHQWSAEWSWAHQSHRLELTGATQDRDNHNEMSFQSGTIYSL